MSTRIWIGLFVITALGAGLLCAPLWSQSEPEPAANTEPPPVRPNEPSREPGAFQFPLDPLSASIDLNGDQEISADEMAQASKSMMALDRNRDGKLTPDEVLPPFLLGGGPGFGGPGGPLGGAERKILKQYDLDHNGFLSAEERVTARKNSPAPTGRGGRPGGPGMGNMNSQSPVPGHTLNSAEIVNYPDKGLYDPATLRTLIIQFENKDWEQELTDFHNTDVEVPATVTVDGQVYPNVGVHFRGMSSYMMVGQGYKRSLNLAMDLVDSQQRLYGYKTLNLLNSNGDPAMMSSVLYSHIARPYIPVPQANWVKVYINGEYWGVYVNVEQFNKDFLKSNFGTTDGARWKVSGNPGADGGLRYLGEDIEEYRRRFDIKSKDDEASWKALIALCKTIDQTPPDQLEAALAPILNVDGVLRFLALDCTLVNSDGYWTRASDYSLYLDPTGRFHVIPHDMNEAFHSGHGPGFPGFPPGGGGPAGGRPFEGGFGLPPGGFGPPPGEGFGPPPGGFGQRGGGRGPGGPGGMMHGSVDLDPLIGLDDSRKPLRSKLLAVPTLKARYLAYVRTIAEQSLDWQKIGPLVAQYRELIAKDVEADTRKLTSYKAFQAATDPAPPAERQESSLRHFFEARQSYLLKHPEVAAAEAVAITSVAPSIPMPLSPVLTTGIGSKTAAEPRANSPRVIINELMTSNKKTIRDPQGDYDDWIELHNPTGQMIDLSGIYLTDSDQAPRKWRFPNGTQLAAGGYLVLWADEEGKVEEGLHLNFKLSSKGEHLYIVDSDERGNAVLDHVEFGPQTEDVAWGRHPKMPDQWSPLAATPGQPNREGE